MPNARLLDLMNLSSSQVHEGEGKKLQGFIVVTQTQKQIDRLKWLHRKLSQNEITLQLTIQR